MGFRMRKSINLGGGFKINFSKSGIGYSWGVPGYRISKTARGKTRSTYSIPGTGVSYVKESGRNRNKTASLKDNATNNTQPVRQQAQAHSFESADIESFKSAEVENITSAIERTIKLNKWSTILMGCSILIPAYPVLAVLPIVGVVIKVVARKLGAVQLAYTLNDEKEDEYSRRIGAWQILAEGDKEWQIIQETRVSNQKADSDVSRYIKRVVCKIKKTTPFYIKTNVDTIQIKLHEESLIFLPDKVFIIRKGKVGLVNYEDISILVSQKKYVESDPVPKDAIVVSSTWQYANKNGTPDRRYRNNRQLPICQYGVVHLISDTGLNVEMQFSNVNKTQDFEALIS